MKTKRLIIAAAILFIAGNAVGQDYISQSMRVKHSLQLSIGLLSDYGVESEFSTALTSLKWTVIRLPIERLF